MHWLFLILAFAAMAFAFMASSTATLTVCLLLALLMFVLWIFGMYSSRFSDHGRDASLMIDPAELRRLREQAEARKAAAAAESQDPRP